MKNWLVMLAKLLVFVSFTNAHAASMCKAITLLMPYKDVAKALNGRLDNCSAIAEKINPESKAAQASNPYYNYVHYAFPDCGDPKLTLDFSHGYLTAMEDDSATLSPDGATLYPPTFRPCLAEEVIQLGMTYQQIVKVLNKKGNIVSKPHTNSYGIYMADYQWDIEAIGSVTVGFENNKTTTISLDD